MTRFIYPSHRDKISFEWTATDTGPVLSCGTCEAMTIEKWPARRYRHEVERDIIWPVPVFMTVVPVQILINPQVSLGQALEAIDSLRALVIQRLEAIKGEAPANRSNLSTYDPHEQLVDMIEHRAQYAQTGVKPPHKVELWYNEVHYEEE